MVLTQKNIHIYMRMVHKCIQQDIMGQKDMASQHCMLKFCSPLQRNLSGILASAFSCKFFYLNVYLNTLFKYYRSQNIKTRNHHFVNLTHTKHNALHQKKRNLRRKKQSQEFKENIVMILFSAILRILWKHIS